MIVEFLIRIRCDSCRGERAIRAKGELGGFDDEGPNEETRQKLDSQIRGWEFQNGHHCPACVQKGKGG